MGENRFFMLHTGRNPTVTVTSLCAMGNRAPFNRAWCGEKQIPGIAICKLFIKNYCSTANCKIQCQCISSYPPRLIPLKKSWDFFPSILDTLVIYRKRSNGLILKLACQCIGQQTIFLLNYFF